MKKTEQNRPKTRKSGVKTEQAMTMKQAMFVKEYVKSKGNGTAAALAVYDTDLRTTAWSIASENLRKPYIAEAIKSEMEKQGLTMEAIVAPVAKAINAQNALGKDDLELQLKAHDRAMKMMSFGEDKQPQGNTFNFVNNGNFNASKYKND